MKLLEFYVFFYLISHFQKCCYWPDFKTCMVFLGCANQENGLLQQLGVCDSGWGSILSKCYQNQHILLVLCLCGLIRMLVLMVWCILVSQRCIEVISRLRLEMNKLNFLRNTNNHSYWNKKTASQRIPNDYDVINYEENVASDRMVDQLKQHQG